MGNSPASHQFFHPNYASSAGSVLRFERDDHSLKPLNDVFGDKMVEHNGTGWTCHYCKKSWNSINVTRILRHFVTTSQSGITKCLNTTGRLTEARKKRFNELYQKLEAKRRKLNSPKPNNVSSRWFGSHVSDTLESSTSALSQSESSSKPSNIAINTDPTYLRNNNQASIESAFFGDSNQFSNTVAKFVLQSGLPFSVVERN